MGSKIEKIKQVLDKNSINYHLARYSLDTKSVTEAAKQIDLPEERIIKSLIFKCDNGFVMFLLSSNKKVDIKKVKNLLNGKIEIAQKEEVERVTGYKIGTVNPFHVKTKILIYLDTSVI